MASRRSLGGDVAVVRCVCEGSKDSKPHFFRSLRYGVGLHLAKHSTVNSVVGLPPALKLGAYYVPAEQPTIGADRSHTLVITTSVPARLYVLWPALQEPPVWLCDDFEMIRGAEVKVRWGDFTLKQDFYLNVTNQHFIYEEQVLHVYMFIDNHGIIQAGESVKVPYAPEQQLSSSRPYYSHVVCLSTSLHPVSGSSVSGPGNNIDLQNQAAGPVRLGLQEIHSGLEDGSFDPSKLSVVEADTLLNHAMAAGDDELLFMLLEGGTASSSSRPCLQLVLQYARYEGLPQLAQEILQQTEVEVTRPVLDWLVQHFMKNGYNKEAEAFLSNYCRSRRNPLNAVAAVEYSLSKASTSSVTVNNAAVKLAKKFGSAKMALLQQLVQHYESGYSGAADDKSGSQSSRDLGNTTFTSLPDAGGVNESPLQLQPLLAALRQCLQEFDAHTLGRRSSNIAISIHDSSPYTFAVGLEDTEFLRTPAVIQYTRKLWSGLELPTIAQAACKAAAANGDRKQRRPGDLAIRGIRKSGTLAKMRTLAKKTQIVSPVYPLSPRTPRGGWTNPASAVDSSAITPSLSFASKSSMSFQGTSGTADFGDNGAAESLVWLNPDVGVELLQNIGLSSHLGQPFARAGISLLHTLLLTPRALHDAARGRWLKRCFFEGIFLVIYQAYCSQDFTLAVYLLPIWLVGNLASSALEVRWLHEGSFNQYSRDNWSKLDVLLNTSLLGVCAWELYLVIVGTESIRGNTLEPVGVDLQQVVPAALSVLVWIHALGVVQPISERMGALMYTLKRAAAEAVMLVPLVAVLICGFASSLHVVYRNVSTYYSTYLGALRMAIVCLLSGDSMLLDFANPDQSHGIPFLEIWGQVMLILFGVSVNILIVSLLTAVITKTYSREQVIAKAVLVEAEAVRQYDLRVRHFLAVSPLNLVQTLLFWLPQGHRSRVTPANCIKYLIPPLDGYVPVLTAAAPELLLPTGAPEVGYIGFLLFLYPLISVAALLLMIVHLPFGVLHYAIRGHKLWITSWSGSAGKARLDKQNPAVAQAAAKLREQLGNVNYRISGSITGPVAVAALIVSRRTRFMQFIMGPDDADAPAGVGPVHAQVKAPFRMSKMLRHAAGSLLRGMFYCFDTFVELPVRVAFATVIGAIIHVVLLALLVLILIWAWFTRILFCLYCLFWPWAGNVDHHAQITRTADFWSKENVHDAFTQANLSVGPTFDQVQAVPMGSTDLQELSLARHDPPDGTAECKVRVKDAFIANGLNAAPAGLALPNGGRQSPLPGERMPAELEVEYLSGGYQD